MYLEVAPDGSKKWRLKYRVGGVEKRISLGVYPEVSLLEAREKLHEHKKMLRDGQDPSVERRRSKARARSFAAFTGTGRADKKSRSGGHSSLGLHSLPWTDELRQLQARVLITPLGRTRLAGLDSGPEATWLFPWLHGVNRRSQFSGINLGAALRALLPWPLPQRLEAEAPARLDLPSGSSARLDYLPVLHGDPPVLAVKLQEMFGSADTPRLAGGRRPGAGNAASVVSRRMPLQITGDLRRF